MHRPPREGHGRPRAHSLAAHWPPCLARSLVGRRIRSRARRPVAARPLARRSARLARDGGSLPIPLSALALCGPRRHGCSRRPLRRVSLIRALTDPPHLASLRHVSLIQALTGPPHLASFRRVSLIRALTGTSHLASRRRDRLEQGRSRRHPRPTVTGRSRGHPPRSCTPAAR